MTPDAGWYHDSNGQVRYWDGATWWETPDAAESATSSSTSRSVTQRTTRPIVAVRADTPLEAQAVPEGCIVTFHGLPVPGAPIGPPPSQSYDPGAQSAEPSGRQLPGRRSRRR